jgi:regulator of protease activity HflC (stomatin/prohibitin superfamily)
MRRIAYGLAALALLVLTGCSAPATNSDEVFVHKGQGITEGKENKGCVDPATRQIFWGTGMGDEFFAYPSSQRVFDFRGTPDSDRGPFEVVSKDGQTLQIPGTMSFLLNIDCDTLHKFHDRIGNRDHAYMEDNQTGDGWKKVLNLYMAPPLDASLDRLAKQYTWNELRSDPSIKDKINAEVNSTIARLIDQQMEGTEQFFTAYSTLITQPIAPESLVAAVRQQEESKAQAAATEAKAEADAAAAEAAAISQVAQKEAELKVARLQAQILAAEIAAHGGPALYNEWLIANKGLNPRQPTYGGNTLVNP